MAVGRQGRGAPYPYHAKLDGMGVMLTSQKAGKLDWDAGIDPVQGPEGVGTQRQALLRSDFTGGFGQMRDDESPEARRALFFSRVYDRAGRDAVGGGIDPRWGGLMRGPRVQLFGDLISTPLPSYEDTSRVVRKIAVMIPSSGTYVGKPVYLVAIGSNLIGTTDPLTWTNPTAKVLHVFKDGSGNHYSIKDLKVYGSRNGTPELEIALEGWPRHVTYDLSTFTPDGTTAVGSASNRLLKPQAVYIFNSTKNEFEDVTATMTDDDADTGTGHLLANFGKIGDYILVGFRHAFDSIKWKFGGHVNGHPNVAHFKYWNGTAWSATGVTAFTDGTTDGANSFAKSGEMTWTLDGTATWTPAAINNQYDVEPLYFVQLTWDNGAGASAPFDDNVVLNEASIRYRLQPDAYAVSGTHLVMVQDNALITSPGGGTEGLIYDTTGPFAIPSEKGGAFSSTAGHVVAAVNLAGTIYVIKTDGIFSVTQDGQTRELAPHWAEQPAVEGVDRSGTGNDVDPWENQGVTVWNNHIYAANDWEILQIAPDGSGTLVGPERLTFGASTTQFRATALEGHGLHFLYAAFKGSDGNAYLGAYGIYRHVTDWMTRVEQWTRMDVWAIIGDLGGRTITSMKVVYSPTTANPPNQPYLLMGDEFGEMLVASLPRAFHPQDAGSGYAWSDALAEVVFPAYDGFDPTRAVTAYRSTWRLRYADATHAIQLWTKGGHPDTATPAWALRCTATDLDGDGFDDQPFGTVHDAHGLNVKLRLLCPTHDYAVAPILDAFAPWYRQSPSADQRRASLNIQAHNRVTALNGRRIPRTVSSWETFAYGLLGRRVELVTPTGAAEQVMVDAIKETIGRPNPQGPPEVAYLVSVSSAG